LALIGQIELFFDRGNHFEFLSQEKELLPAGVLEKSQEFDFEFGNAPKPHECYCGVNVRLRYFLRVTVLRQMATNVVKELDLWVNVYQSPPDVNNTIKMEVGIEDCFSEDCEILTNRGFLDLDAYKAALAADPDLRVAAFDRAAHRLVYQRGELVEHERATRTLVEFADADSQADTWAPDADADAVGAARHARGVGLLVTPGHRMLAKHAKWSAKSGGRRVADWSRAGEYRECEARELLTPSDAYGAVKMMAVARNGVAVDAHVAADWSCLAALCCAGAGAAAARDACLALYGRWLVAGALDARAQHVLFSHSGADDAAWLAARLTDAGLRAGVDFVAAPAATRVSRAAWWHFYAAEAQRQQQQQQQNDDGAWMAPWVWSRDAAALQCLLSGVSSVVTTSSVRFRDELVRVATLAGATARFVASAERDGALCWHVELASAADAAVAEPVLYKQRARRADDEVRAVKYTGRVWCVRVPTTFIVARRAHKVDGVVRKASRALMVGNCLHIEFEYGKSKYHLKDVVIGKIYFLLVRIKIKHMEIALLKRESTGSGANVYNESETLTKFEIMDGAPVRGESIPVRLFLGGFDLTPSYRNVEQKFSLKYYLNLVLVDEEDRRYFKQQEITLWRKVPAGMQISQNGSSSASASGDSQFHSYHGPREVAAEEEAERKEAEVRRANEKKKKSKKSKAKEEKKQEDKEKKEETATE
jgi:hypothetical protein